MKKFCSQSHYLNNENQVFLKNIFVHKKKGKQGTHWHQTHMSLTQTEISSFLFCQAMTETKKESKNTNKKSKCEQQRSQQVMKTPHVLPCNDGLVKSLMCTITKKVLLFKHLI